jgi:D-alanyl-D-alanine carboxypeptidase/D-alanyl-D-alanine-endopeptidase (penicillin-binding protein 4)
MRKLILASLTISAAAPLLLGAQSLQQRLNRLLDAPPFNRATWNIYAQDDRGRVLFNRNGDAFPCRRATIKLVVAAAAMVLLPENFRVRTSVYVNGTVTNAVLQGDLILYGGGDPTWSRRCYTVDTLAPGGCDSTWTAVDALADSLRGRGIQRITGQIIGDGSYFEPTLTHSNWSAFDLNWWYAAPVSGLGFHDNSVDFQITPGPFVDAPPVISWNPDLSMFVREPRAHRPRGFRGRRSTTTSFATRHTGYLGRGDRGARQDAVHRELCTPDPNLYAARRSPRPYGRKGPRSKAAPPAPPTR